MYYIIIQFLPRHNLILSPAIIPGAARFALAPG